MKAVVVHNVAAPVRSMKRPPPRVSIELAAVSIGLLLLISPLTDARSQTAMKHQERQVANASELLAAAADATVAEIIVQSSLTGLQTFRLSPGQTLKGATSSVILHFATGGDGVQLSSNNLIESLELQTDVDRRALFNDTRVEHLGRIVLRHLRTIGTIRLLANDKVRSGHVEAENVDIASADARGYTERPKGYGVEVIPGAFVLWNQQADRSVTITAELTGLTAGRAGAPVRGSGIFVSGAGETGGRLIVSRLETGAVYSDGGIAAGTPDRISGGVFVVSGTFVDRVINRGSVTTYSSNDMVLDNWVRSVIGLPRTRLRPLDRAESVSSTSELSMYSRRRRRLRPLVRARAATTSTRERCTQQSSIASSLTPMVLSESRSANPSAGSRCIGELKHMVGQVTHW